jgi:hypothetical protein
MNGKQTEKQMDPLLAATLFQKQREENEGRTPSNTPLLQQHVKPEELKPVLRKRSEVDYLTANEIKNGDWDS